ncbi:hypothetical protein QJS04_geneDACA001179 [Acorus gramineus]|uniref:Choline transporter-like protein n=1 Tax=Acorus gramineus TaxID=55184 RepID=A0AAV9ABR8_ACOGR|nr:hypothetical protein QJS04_geneDACA001179 [Acorus gramineus]
MMSGGGGGGGEEDLPQPLLSKPYLPPSDEPTTSNYESEPEYPLITFNHGPRPFKDLPFLLLFALLSLSTFAFGLFSVFHHNPHRDPSSFSYDPSSSSCAALRSHSPNRILESQPSALWKDLIWTLVITLALSAPIALFLLWLLRRHAKQVVYGCLPFFVLAPAFFNVYWFVACTMNSKCSASFGLAYRIVVLVFVFVLIGIIGWIIVANWHRIELTIRIIGVAGEALARNLGLFGVLPLMTLGLLVYFAPVVVFMVYARMNGRVLPRMGSSGLYNCVWKQDKWVPAYFALAILTMLWSAVAMVEAKVYVISGTIAQWYFSKEDSRPGRSIRSSLRHAFGPSFGTVCFSGLIMAAVRLVRAAVDSAKREDGTPGIVTLILRCCVNFCMSAIDFLNKFTINFAAITGESYCYSAMMSYELLKRNLLSPVFVETVSTRILVGIIFVLSAVYAIVVCAVLKAVTALGVDAYFVAALAWALLILILGFFVHVMDNVIDTIYVCYAIDRDKGEVCKHEVHEVYVCLPISRCDRPSIATRTPLNV